MAAVQNASKCMRTNNQAGSVASTINVTVSTTAGRQSTRPIHDGGYTGRRAKTRMNVSRYNARGRTQNSGNGATSVVRYVVTPNIKLDGKAARNTQRNRRLRVTVATRFKVRSAACSSGGTGVGQFSPATPITF